MEIKVKKPIERLEREITLKSVDLDEDINDFSVDIQDYKYGEKLISISPRCIRCNICYEECPVQAISSATALKTAKIHENCVQCEICVQSCPVSCIYLLETESEIDKEDGVMYSLNEIKIPHRTLKMEDISIDRNYCTGCGSCIKFCPTNAISLRSREYIEAHGESCPDDKDLTDSTVYSYIDKNRCVGCGSCVNLCINGVISLKRDLGPVIIYSHIDYNKDACVGCTLCEENCPVNAARYVDGEVIVDDDKCIRCKECTTHCPVNALVLVMND